MSSKQIADASGLPERTVKRIFAGESSAPFADTLYRIVVVLGGSLDDILADSNAVVSSHGIVELKEKLEKMTDEVNLMHKEKENLVAELEEAKSNARLLHAELELLRMKLEHKEEIISLHNYYIGAHKRKRRK